MSNTAHNHIALYSTHSVPHWLCGLKCNSPIVAYNSGIEEATIVAHNSGIEESTSWDNSANLKYQN